MPGSPAMSTASSSLAPHLPPHLRPSTIVTRKDQADSLAAYEGLLTASKAYTQALLGLSSASNDFAFALQDCARLKGSHKVGSQLHAASGLEFLVASHSKLLADEFWKGFSIPLLESFDTHRQAVAERQMAHERVMAERSRELKECEEKNMRGAARKRGKERDLGSFRRALEELQRMVNGLDEERAGHYVEVLGAEEEEWENVVTRVSVRSMHSVASEELRLILTTYLPLKPSCRSGFTLVATTTRGSRTLVVKASFRPGSRTYAIRYPRSLRSMVAAQRNSFRRSWRPGGALQCTSRFWSAG